jgi:hypothetical protein
MSDITAPTPELEAPSVPLISLNDLLPYALFITILATLLLYPGMTLHEWVHDARHLLGFPCH